MSDITLEYLDAVKLIKKTILQSRYCAARVVNSEQLKLYFRIGAYISKNTRQGTWATGAIEVISKQLQAEMPGLRGFSPSNIKYMRQFYETWQQSPEVIRQLSTGDLNHHQNTEIFPQNTDFTNRQLSTGDLPTDDSAFVQIGFTHHVTIFSVCKSEKECWYYIRRCAAEFWRVETLKSHLRANDFFHHGMLPNNFLQTILDEKNAIRAVKIFKDEYLLDYINIEDSDDEERGLENAIVIQIKKFIMSLGSDFCFIGNQYRIMVDKEEFFIDLLFFHRTLQCLVAVELKRGKFRPSHLGQLNFYLSALDSMVKKPEENPSIGIILCQEANRAVVELAVSDFNKPMGIAIYRTANDIPKPYQSLIPVINGVQKILTNDRNHLEDNN
jgi:predicted nuclease of restriction endonuclease-like (RecB) superfamily